MSKYQSKIIKKYEDKGYLVLKTIRLNVNGYPDLLCLKSNEPTIFIEVKEAKDALKPLQKLRIDELNKLGFNAFCLQDGKGIVYPDDKEKETLDF